MSNNGTSLRLFRSTNDYRYQLECGVGHEAVPLLDAVQAIYDLRQPRSLVSDEDYVRLYRGRIGLAASAKDEDNLLH